MSEDRPFKYVGGSGGGFTNPGTVADVTLTLPDATERGDLALVIEWSVPGVMNPPDDRFAAFHHYDVAGQWAHAAWWATVGEDLSPVHMRGGGSTSGAGQFWWCALVVLRCVRPTVPTQSAEAQGSNIPGLTGTSGALGVAFGTSGTGGWGSTQPWPSGAGWQEVPESRGSSGGLVSNAYIYAGLAWNPGPVAPTVYIPASRQPVASAILATEFGCIEPVIRLHPRDDGRGTSSAPRQFPPHKARRIVGGPQ